jgi:AcrR family transcriptional regulator
MTTNDVSSSTREILLDATDRLLAKHGYKRMTIEDLAKEAGIGKGSVYLHFSSKEEIALSHIDRIIDRMLRRMAEHLRSEKSSSERLRKLIIDRVLYRFDSVQHYSQSLNELLSQLRPRLLARRAHYFEEEAKVISEALRAGQNDGTFAIDDPLETARTIIDATNALLPYSLSAYELGERSLLEAKAGRVADLLLSGLIARK